MDRNIAPETADLEFSVVIPVYRGEASVRPLCDQLEAAFGKMGIVNYEIIFVDDRGPDRAWDVLRTLRAERPHVQILRFSRNFGQHAAILAGLQASRGRLIAVMDCDLQDDPAALIPLYDRLKSSSAFGVVAQRQNRRDRVDRQLSSKVFYWLLSKMAGLSFEDGIANFGIYRRQIFASILGGTREVFFYFPAFVQWVGFELEYVTVPHASRFDEAGSSYSTLQRLRLGLGIILSFSSLPLYYLALFGVVFLVLSAGLILSLVAGHLMSWFTVPGWASIVAAVLFCSSVIVIFMGLIGLYVAKIYEETKGRPKYIIETQP